MFVQKRENTFCLGQLLKLKMSCQYSKKFGLNAIFTVENLNVCLHFCLSNLFWNTSTSLILYNSSLQSITSLYAVEHELQLYPQLHGNVIDKNTRRVENHFQINHPFSKFPCWLQGLLSVLQQGNLVWCTFHKITLRLLYSRI